MSYFDWVPFLEGKYITYQNWFAFVGAFVALAISLVCFLVSLILFEFTKSKQHNMASSGIKQIELAHTTPLNQNLNNNRNESNNSLDDDNYSKPESYTSACCDSKGKDIFRKLSRFFRTLGFFFLTFIPIICGAFTVISTPMSMAITAAITLTLVTINDIKNNPNLERPAPIQWKIKKALRKSLKKSIIQAIAYSFFLPFFFHNTCMSFYNNSIGYYNSWLGFVINTQLTRSFQLPKACPPGPPCHVYATVPEDTSTSAFLNIHTNTNVNKGVVVNYDELSYWNISQSTRLKVMANTYQLNYMDNLGERNVHTALFLNLIPETSYIFRVVYDNQVQSEHIYRTLPGRNSTRPITMINSGDSGHTDVVKTLNDGVAKQNPDIWFIGGDLAYDDNIDACYYTWDMYISDFERVFKKIGYIFPVVLGIGNHDVGLNELPGINITVTYNGPQFHTYFPQHFVRDPNSFAIVKAIPDIRDRSTTFYKEFGNSVYISLDSGYMMGYDGWQRDFLENVLKTHSGWSQFVNYHVPIFSICAHFDHDLTPIVHGLKYWVPLFDKYKVAASYENHVHAFKRTKPLFGNNVAVNGTIYLGDGAYGAIPSTSCELDSNTDIFASMGKFNNYWVSQIIPDKSVEHWAYDGDGDVADHYLQQLEYYVSN